MAQFQGRITKDYPDFRTVTKDLCQSILATH